MNDFQDFCKKHLENPDIQKRYNTDIAAADALVEKWQAEIATLPRADVILPMAVGKAFSRWLREAHYSPPALDKKALLVGSFFRAICAGVPEFDLNNNLPEQHLFKLLALIACTEPYQVQINAAAAMIASGLEELAKEEGCDMSEAARRHNLPMDVIDTSKDKLN